MRRISFFVLFLTLFPTLLFAQQGRGLFFSVFGKDAPNTYGDFDNYQSFYFDIPTSETQPVYLRIFDPDVGGAYDEKHGEFDTETRFVVLGGNSANLIYGGSSENAYNKLDYDKNDVLYNRVFGANRKGDGRWYSLLELKLENGYDLGNGFVRFSLLSIGLGGDDGNFFDLALSYSQTEKRPPSTSYVFVYDLSLRSPSLLLYNWDEFRGQIKLNTEGVSQIDLSTFDMDDVPISLSIPFLTDLDLKTSGDGNWVENSIDLSQYNSPREVGFNFYGRPFNNTFGFFAKDQAGDLIPIILPILDYEPPTYPNISYLASYDSSDCFTVHLQTIVSNQDLVSSLESRWILNSDTLYGNDITRRFDSTGYKPFIWNVKANIGGGVQELTFQDSILINTPPYAWAGGDRANVANNMMAFDGTVSFDKDGKIKRYEWDFGDGTQGEGARIDKKYSQPGLYDVTLRVFDDSDTECGVAISKVQVKINKPPIPRILAPEAVQFGELFTLDGSSSTDPDGNIVDYLWQIGTDTLMEGSVVHYALKSEDNTRVTLQITDDSRTYNSSQRANFTIRVNKRPIASAGDDKVISPNRPAAYSARLSKDPDGQIVDYEWTFPDGQVLKGENVQHSFTQPGVYIVQLKVTDDTNRAFGYDSIQVTVNAPPVAVIKGDKLFNTGRITLDASESYDPDGSIADQFWVVNGNTYSGAVLNYAFNKPGVYTVEHTVIDNSGTYSASQTTSVTVQVNDLPIPVIEIPEKAATLDPITFSAAKSSDSDGEIVSYVWDFGDGNSAKGVEVEYDYINPGTYQVSLAVQDNFGSGASTVITTKEIHINAPPKLEYTFPSRVTAGQNVILDLSKSYDPDGRITEYAYFLDGKWKTGLSKQVIPIIAGLTEIPVSIKDNSGLKNNEYKFNIPVVFNESPVAIGNGPIKSSSQVIFFDGTKSYDPDDDQLKYYWDFGDGKTAQGPISVHRYRYGGSYRVLLTVDDQQGLDNSIAYDTVLVFINRSPEPYAELPSLLCVGDTLFYNASNSYDPDGSAMRFDWNFGDGTAAQGAKGKKVFDQEGRYQIVLVVDDNQGMNNSTATLSQTVNVIGAPQAFAGDDFTACEGEVIRFNGNGSKAGNDALNEYRWDFGDKTSSLGIEPQHIYEKPGKYKVTLKVTSNVIGACKNSDVDVIYVTVLPKPKADFTLPSVIRTGDSVRFDPQPSFVENQLIKRITWQIGGYETITFNRTRKVDDIGSPNFVWQINSTLPITEREVPDRSALGILPSFERVLPNGEFAIVLEIETSSVENCNSAQQVRYLTIKDRPQLSISTIPTLVPGIPFQFSGADLKADLNDIKSAYWTFGDGATKQGLFATHTYSKPGTYEIEFIADDGSGGASAVVRMNQMVVVNAQPTASFIGPERSLPNEELTFDASESSDEDGEISAYNWFFSDGYRTTGKVVKRSFSRTGNYMVTLSVSDNANAPNSLNSVSKSLRVMNAPDLTIKLPSSICPDQKINFISALSIPTNDTSKVQIFIGNNKLSYSQAKNFSFSFPGTYNLRVLVMSSGTDGAAILRETLFVNGPPEIFADVPETITIGAANEMAIFDASKSYDPNGDLVRITWSFGDGQTAFGKKVQHQYQKPGTYSVKVTIIDDKGTNCSQAEKTYTVRVVKS